jgi:hypothetical protein
MNNILLNFFIYIIEILCGYTEEKDIPDVKPYDSFVKSYDSYFLYDLETDEVVPLYE